VFDDLASLADERAIPAGARLEPQEAAREAYVPMVAQYIQWQSLLAKSFGQPGG
jgi:hypothetical protein